RRHGIKADAALLRIEQRYRDVQNEDGSWGYMEGYKELKDATTCAALIGLAAGIGVRNDQAKGKDKATKSNPLKDDTHIVKGMGYLAKAVGRSFQVTETMRNKRTADTNKMLELIQEYLKTTGDERERVAAQLRNLDRPDFLKGTIIAADAWGDLYF